MHDLRKKYDIGELLRANAVTIMFVVLCIICLIFSGQTVPYVMYELFGRLSRNAFIRLSRNMFIVLSLIIPIVAGMGINFAITIGAMAAQISALWVIEWGISGLGGFLVAMLLFCGVRQRVERSNPPESFKGLPITLVSAAITAMSFMGFGGLVENIIAALM